MEVEDGGEPRDPATAAAVLRRLSRIEGQVRAARARVEADAYCLDLVKELVAIRGALDSVTAQIVARHVRTCLGEEAPHRDASGKSHRALADELGEAVARLLG